MRPSIEFAKGYFGNKQVTGVEVGVAQAQNAQDMLTNWDKITTLHLVDINADLLRAGGALRLQKFKDRFIIHPYSSEESATRIPGDSLDFCYIDADHSYEAVKLDIALWYARVKPAGVVAGHDYSNSSVPGVKQAVDEFVADYKLTLNTKGLDWWIVK